VVESGLIYNLTMFRYIKLEESKYIIVSVIFIKKKNLKICIFIFWYILSIVQGYC